MRDSFIFYSSFLDCLDELEPEIELEVYRAITHYAIKEEIPELSGVAKAIFCLIKPQIDANNKRYEDGKKGGRPKNENKKTSGFENKKPVVLKNDGNKKPNVNDNVNVNENVNVNVEVVEETSAPTKNDFSDLSFWHGEYSNVHLTDKQYSKLIQHVGKKEMLDGLIEDLSANIASKKENAPPYDENYPDMHYAKLKAYWDYRRLKGNKPKNYNDKQEEFKAKLKALADKYRVNDERERVNSG